MTLPKHIAIIMDGNGRWAQRRGLPRVAGHREGLRVAKEIVAETARLGIPVLTLFAFSTENWRRPPEEVGFLMELLEEAVAQELAELARHNVVLRAIGRLGELSPRAQSALARAMETTAHNTGLILNLAINYGGRAEIVDAVRAVAQRVQQGELTPEMVNEEVFSSFLTTAGLPDPDLIIRSGGELRLSNFLLWQGAYAEFYSTPVLWPDFRPCDLHAAIEAYQQRERRFGSVSVKGREE
ncbi:MAG: isoprenyl transferase [Bacillota bacterium]|nr:isoprenyl transferase [Bacillota bacterium]